VARGKLVRTRLLCHVLPEPPGDVDTMLKPARGAESTRERFARHAEDPACAGCHRLIDPIGNGFEHYDAFGRRREHDNGAPVDATGRIVAVPEGEVAFKGVGELAAYLARSQEVKTCAVRFFAYYAYGLASWAEDACTYGSIHAEAAKGQHSLRSVLLAAVRAPHFVRRVQDR
jgi:hypothetical protein